MPTIEEGLFKHLSEDDAVSAIAETRIYPLIAPENETEDHIVYDNLSSPKAAAHSNDSGLSRSRMRIKAWSTTYAGAKALAEAVRKSLYGHTGALGDVERAAVELEGQPDEYDVETKWFAVVQDALIWHPEALA